MLLDSASSQQRGLQWLTYDIGQLTATEKIKSLQLHVLDQSIITSYKKRLVLVEASLSKGGQTQHVSLMSLVEKKDNHLTIDMSKIIETVDSGALQNATLRFSVKAKRQRHSFKTLRFDDVTSCILALYSNDDDFSSSFQSALTDKIFNNHENTMKLTRRRRATFPVQGKTPLRRRTGRDCEKLDFYVDFDEIGWGEWIVYPTRYNAYYCGGKCPHVMDESYTPTNHAVLQGLMRRRNRENAPRACCVPAKLQPITMLYHEHEEWVIRRHENMVVETCGCR